MCVIDVKGYSQRNLVTTYNDTVSLCITKKKNFLPLLVNFKIILFWMYYSTIVYLFSFLFSFFFPNCKITYICMYSKKIQMTHMRIYIYDICSFYKFSQFSRSPQSSISSSRHKNICLKWILRHTVERKEIHTSHIIVILHARIKDHTLTR